MTVLISTAFVASLLGSLHCAGMCGVFVAFAVTTSDSRSSRCVLQLAYHGARLLAYAALGAVAGSIGAAIDLVGGSLVGVQRLAAVLAGVLMVSFGSVVMLRFLGARISNARTPPVFERLLARTHSAAACFPPLLRAATIGLLTALLPCGWLWAFVVAAAGSGGPLAGAVLLTAFWLGTVPLLALVGFGAGKLFATRSVGVQLAASLVVIVLGVATLVGRWDVPVAASRMEPSQSASTEAAVEHVRSLDPADPPCCKHDS